MLYLSGRLLETEKPVYLYDVEIQINRFFIYKKAFDKKFSHSTVTHPYLPSQGGTSSLGIPLLGGDRGGSYGIFSNSSYST